MKVNSFSEVAKLFAALPAKASATTEDELSTAQDLTATAQCGSGAILINVGAETGAPSSYSIVYTLYECATSGGSYTAVSGAALTVTAAGVYEIQFKPTSLKRYIKVGRLTTIVAGTSPKVPNGASVILMDPKYGPI